MAEHMLTTIDNPWNPFTHFEEWLHWDTAAGYHTTEYLARIAVFSDDLSEADQSLAIENAIDEIVEENVLGIYIKASPPAPDASTEQQVSMTDVKVDNNT